MRLLFVALVALIAQVDGSEAATFPAPDGNCPTADQTAGLCTTQRGFVIEPHAVYPRIENIGGIPHKIYTVRVTPKGSAGGCTSTAANLTMSFESPIVPGSCQPQPQTSLFGCTGGCSINFATGLAGSLTGNMAANLRTIDTVKFTKNLTCNAAPVDLTLVFTSTDTSAQTLDVDFSDFMITGGPTAVGMIPGPFCVPTKPEPSIISTKYTIEGHGEFTVILDTTGGVVEVLDVNGNPAPVIPLTETFTCTPAAGRCPTLDSASFCTTATGPELLCEQNVAALGEVVLKTGEQSACYKLIGGALRRVC